MTRSDRVPEELWMEVHDIVQEAGIRPFPRKRNAERQNNCLRRFTSSYEKKQKAKEKRKGIPI